MNSKAANAPKGATHIMKRVEQPSIYLKDVDMDALTCSVWSSYDWIKGVGFFIGDNIEIIRVDDKPRIKPTAWQPKVGEECEVLHGDEWIISIYLGIDIYGSYAYQIAEGDYKGEFNADKNINNFRPIKTERDQLIEIIDSCNMSSGVLADLLLDAGYRKTGEGK